MAEENLGQVETRTLEAALLKLCFLKDSQGRRRRQLGVECMMMKQAPADSGRRHRPSSAFKRQINFFVKRPTQEEEEKRKAGGGKRTNVQERKQRLRAFFSLPSPRQLFVYVTYARYFSLSFDFAGLLRQGCVSASKNACAGCTRDFDMGNESGREGHLLALYSHSQSAFCCNM